MVKICAFMLFVAAIASTAADIRGKPAAAERHDTIVFSKLPQVQLESRRPLIYGDAAAVQSAPPALQSFNGYINDGRAPSIPDCMGVAGPNHLMITINGLVIIQRRDGQTISSVLSDTFWNGLGTGAFDPRLYYDPFANRWIFSSDLNQSSTNSALLLAVSAGSDPTGRWFRYKIDADPTDTSWADYPKLGFNNRWVVLQANMEPLPGTAATEANRSHLFVFNKTNLYAGGPAQFTYISVPPDAIESYDIVPSANYDATLQSMFLLALRPDTNGSWTDFPPVIRIYELHGAFGSEVLTFKTNAIAPITWPPGRGAASGYQLGTPQVIRILEKSLENVIYRNGTLWTVHNMFPNATNDQSDIQFWQITTNGQVLQFGRVEDPSGNNHYGFPSIAVNKYNDVLMAYTRCASNQYISAKYTFHAGTDPTNTIRGDTILKAGEAPFTIGAPDTYDVLRWGDYTQTVVDPVNDTDFWTLQEYAAADTNSVAGYGLWWGRFVPPSAWPRIISQQKSNNNFVLTFTTSFSNKYNLQRSATIPTNQWTVVQSNIAGSGSIMQATFTNAFPAAKNFFELRLVP